MQLNDYDKLYFDNPNCWEPQIDWDRIASPCLSSFYAVIFPQTMKEIPDLQIYQSYMSLRVAWSMKRFLLDVPIEKEELFRSIQKRLAEAYLDIVLPPMSDSIEEWAKALTESWRMENLWYEVGYDFPLLPLKDAEERQGVKNILLHHNFEEWLIEYSS